MVRRRPRYRGPVSRPGGHAAALRRKVGGHTLETSRRNEEDLDHPDTGPVPERIGFPSPSWLRSCLALEAHLQALESRPGPPGPRDLPDPPAGTSLVLQQGPPWSSRSRDLPGPPAGTSLVLQVLGPPWSSSRDLPGPPGPGSVLSLGLCSSVREGFSEDVLGLKGRPEKRRRLRDV